MRALTTATTVFLAGTLLAVPASAQWNVNDKTVQRANDGTPILTGPAPRRGDGKPDLTGIWISASDPPLIRDISRGLKPGDTISMTPDAQATFDKRKGGAEAALDPSANCLPQGVPRVNMIPMPFKIVQQPDLIVVLYEGYTWFRQIFMDGRQLPTDPNPQWFGYSVARWEGDTLVVNSSGFNGKTWFDQAGHPTTESLRVTERFRRIDIGHLEMQATVDDPGAYTKPFTLVQLYNRVTEGDLLESVCNENNKDLEHLPGR